jgi:hypothetical protein
MKALVHENRVVQVEENEFPVHPSMQWVSCPDEVVAGYAYENGVFIAPVPEEPEVQPIMSIGPMQLADALEDMGMFDTVNDWANAQGGKIAYAWNRATSFERYHPLVLDAQAAFTWSDEQVDALFALAATK